MCLMPGLCTYNRSWMMQRNLLYSEGCERCFEVGTLLYIVGTCYPSSLLRLQLNYELTIAYQ